MKSIRENDICTNLKGFAAMSEAVKAGVVLYG